MAKDYNFKFDYKDLLKGLENMQLKTEVMLRMKAQEGAKMMENYAKQNRPWTDRTGNARRTLHGYVESKLTYIRIYISHGMSYGWSLEYEHERRYAILLPTVNACSDKILKKFSNCLKG